MSFLWYILIGILAGWVAGKIMRGGGFGLVVNLVVGMLGGWLFGLFGLIPVGSIGSFITSVIGAIVLLWLVSFMQPKQKQ